MMNSGPDMRNMLLAIGLSIAVIALWNVFYQSPHQYKEIEARKIEQQAKAAAETQKLAAPAQAVKPRAEALLDAPRVAIASGELRGSLSLKGARFDDLALVHYKETVDKKSPKVVLLSPSGTQAAYFGEIGWLTSYDETAIPGSDTVWQASAKKLTPDSPVTLTWDNGQGVTFVMDVALDKHFMFTVKQSVINRSGGDISLAPYGLINRMHKEEKTSNYGILHEGLIGVTTGKLEELDYKKIKEEGKKSVADASGWLGIADKYWLTALVPDGSEVFKANYQSYSDKGEDRFQVDYLGGTRSVAAGETSENTVRFFAGAKKVAVLDQYKDAYGIPFFDRSVDFGTLYFLTKPIFLMLNYFYGLLGNFGLAILLLTVVIRLALYPLANKSYKSMGQMKQLMPKIQEIQQRYTDDKMRMNMEIMELYKKEKVNPASGCLPLLIQLPVFFALYKVLFVTIEMRHAPFFGWITDLSAKDTTNIFTLFGLIPWDPPSIMHIGILPVFMTITMIVQQKLSPKPSDATQAQVMAAMPYLFLFMFANFPAGLVIYWAWNNILSILQQQAINRQLERASEKKKQPAEAA